MIQNLRQIGPAVRWYFLWKSLEVTGSSLLTWVRYIRTSRYLAQKFLENVRHRFYSYFVGSFSRPSCFSVSWSTCIFWSFFLGGGGVRATHTHPGLHYTLSWVNIHDYVCEEWYFWIHWRILFHSFVPGIIKPEVQRVRHGPRSARLDFLCSISAAVCGSLPVPAGHALIRDYCPVF